jgi:hypothetical protein
MDLPEWDPVVGMVKSQWLSGPIPAQAALHIQCDQAVSHKRLAPSPAARMSVPPPGHGLEIQMALWSATRARGTSPGSYASIPMGARCGPDPTPNPRAPGHAAARSAAGTASRESDEEKNLLLCGAYRLDTGLLMGTPQGQPTGRVWRRAREPGRRPEERRRQRRPRRRTGGRSGCGRP